MNLDEAIWHALEVSKTATCEECRKDHKQLAFWLMDYRAIKAQIAEKQMDVLDDDGMLIYHCTECHASDTCMLSEFNSINFCKHCGKKFREFMK